MRNSLQNGRQLGKDTTFNTKMNHLRELYVPPVRPARVLVVCENALAEAKVTYASAYAARYRHFRGFLAFFRFEQPLRSFLALLR